MSTTTSVRRIKERGGGGGKITASPVSRVSPVLGRSISGGKEDPRSTSRVRAANQKPALKPMARVDKSAVALAAPVAEDSRSRRSTTSVPRGRSSSPFELSRVMSDFRKNPSKVYPGSVRGKENVIGLKSLSVRAGEKSGLDKRLGKDNGGSQKKDKAKIMVRSDVKEQSLGSVAFLKDLKKNGQVNEESVQTCRENEKGIAEVLAGASEEKELASNSTLSKGSDLEEVSVQSSVEVGSRSCEVGEEIKMTMVEVQSGSTSRESKMVNKVRGCVGALTDNVASNKYPSKLHEKLAFLEGKVKRIASDIKKTKEILDLNNPDTSKMMLSDIQEKITGIEKAMVFVKSGEQKHYVNEEKEVKNSKSLDKGLNAEELEARLFPHHKLIRDRTLSKSTSKALEICALEVGKSTSAVVVDEKSTTLEDNVIVEELLASSSKEEPYVDREGSKLQEMDETVNSIAESSSLTAPKGKESIDALLMADERFNEFDDEENMPAMLSEDEVEENYTHKLNNIGRKTSTGGWFVSEGESVLLAHDDGSCSFYDIANSELKAEYKPPGSVFPNIWQDCWIIRAPSADGCSGKYVVAASAGNSMYSGFCSWDFYTKKVHAFHVEDNSETKHVRPALAPLSNNTMHGRQSTSMATENSQWWYRPCGPLIVSGSCCQRMVQLFDIRDGEQVMKWELQKPLSAMDCASPLQWRNRGKVALAELDSISIWDVSSLSSQALLSVSTSGRKIYALHVNNTDAELGGGVRQRVSSAEAEGNDGVFCTSDSINVLDFRLPSGIGLEIPKVGVDFQSAFSRGDSIYIGCSILRSAAKKQYSSQIQQFSLRKQKLFNTYTLPESNAHSYASALTQVWGSSSYVMGVSGLGLFVFDSQKDEGRPSFTTMDYRSLRNMEIIGPNDMCNPSFDYLSSRVLLISQDRPAQWRYLF